MNLHILHSYDAFIDNKCPKIKKLVKIDHSSDPGLQEINETLRSMFKNDYEMGKKDLNGRGRLIDYGWDLIYRKGTGLFVMIVDLDHQNMNQFSRNVKIELITDLN